ncbi:hypothetical protein, partial [Paraburkholderia sabiae]|uniref:hypothetical protein n=1 Tax=Paraburkholderia sabiae TaxID=273251 RepID=UPI001CC3D54C
PPMIVRIARVKVGNRQAPYPDKTPPSKAGSCRLYRRSSGAMLTNERFSRIGAAQTSSRRSNPSKTKSRIVATKT